MSLRDYLSTVSVYLYVARAWGKVDVPLCFVRLLPSLRSYAVIAISRFRVDFVNCNSIIGLIWERLQTILILWETYSTVTPDTPKVGIRRAHPRILFLLRRYVDPYTDSAIARIDSHSPDESAKAGRTIFMGSPKSFSASAASVALISCRREGTSAGLD